MKIAPLALAIALLNANTNANANLQPSPELTAEELVLLHQLEQDPTKPFEPLFDALASTRKEIGSLNLIMEGEAMKQVSQVTNIIWEQYGRLAFDTEELRRHFREYNEMEVDAFVHRVQSVIQDEFERRSKLPETDEDMMENVWPKKVELSDLAKEINVEQLIRPSIDALGHYVIQTLADKWDVMLEDYSKKCEETVEDKAFVIERELQSATARKKEKDIHTCVTIVQAANQILSSLVQLEQDKTKTDLLTGATLAYGSAWTSDTYQPEIQSLSKDADPLVLGDARVRQYIPEDWERLLPSGWKEWDVSMLSKLMTSPSPQNIVPAYFWHSIPAPLASIIESPFQKAVPAPPETILDSNTHLGSCWKMTGRSGKVTLQLAKPAYIDSITIDHYPWIPSAHNPKEHINHITSAPRFMRVQGYPSCDGDAECLDHHGFDVAHPTLYNSFEYKIDASLLGEDEVSDGSIQVSSSQTFQLTPAAFMSEDDEEEDNPGGCSAVKPTCDGGPPSKIQAVTLVIDDNWGHPDYTCIYRIRINGKK